MLFNIKFSPESLAMLVLAFGLDITGIVLLLCALDDFGLLDVVGIIFINSWLLMRGKKMIETRKGGITGALKKLFTHKWGKFALPTFTELVPYLGAFPMWTLSVLCNLDEEEQ